MSRFPTKKALEIVQRVAIRNGVAVDDILGDSRAPHLTRARHHSWMLMEDAGARPTDIGRLMDRDHSTIQHGIKMARLRQDEILQPPQPVDTAKTPDGVASQNLHRALWSYYERVAAERGYEDVFVAMAKMNFEVSA